MKKWDTELTVGLFIVAGFACLAYLAVQLGRVDILNGGGYELVAEFSDTGGMREGAAVVIAGVEIGHVREIALQEFRARVNMEISPDVEVPADSIASIKTQGLIGEKFVEISPGASDEALTQGDRIRDTQPPVDLLEAISNYVFGKL